ncbi:hypothetical protein [Flavobacterium macacae]|uniref:GLPGLI family protein n=1 Tax=Flavobacterium macacae TaxID=2488993 RepID=A0A3P3WJD4_9FLAO|nr:hypothetical protein [Flavobacterium macacae]RRJ92893.1 hypothetical protein EG849_04705 [Flavobacterium macacae]
MKTKLSIILFLLSLSHFAFGQRGDSHTFNFKVKFDNSIPVEQLQIFYTEYSANRITSINYETNEENEIIFNGVNHSIAGAGNYFPTLIFSFKEDKPLNGSNEKVETYRLFYLISETETFLKDDMDKEILFTNSNHPYFIKVDFKWENNKRVYKVAQVPLIQISPEILGVITANNTFIKINPK